MNDILAGLEATVLQVARLLRFDATSGEAAGVDVERAAPVRDLALLRDGELAVLVERLGMLRRQVDAVHARVAGEVAERSRTELGIDGFARRQGYRSAAGMLAFTGALSPGEAKRLLTVGVATAPTRRFSGEAGPARYPHVAAALRQGRIGVSQAGAIITLLERVAGHCTLVELERAERTLAEQAAGLTVAQLQRVIQRAEAYLLPDGLPDREDEHVQRRSLRIRHDRLGRVHLDAVLDPETAAPIVQAIEALVSECLRSSSGRTLGDAGVSGALPQMRADALAALCRHALACEHADVPTGGATVVVRVGLEQLQAGVGQATIDGLDAPISISAVRRLAADASVIPFVLGGASEPLDWGRTKRLFTPAQKLALLERDGGCASCGAPPGICQVHHIRWWQRDSGPTDLANGVVLCSACHHRVHRDEWDIAVDGPGLDATVWFTPPAHVDVARRPRAGGRRRYDYCPVA